MRGARIEVLAIKYGTFRVTDRDGVSVLMYDEQWGPGSVTIPNAPVPLYRFHDRKMPVGILTEFRETSDGLIGTGYLSGSPSLQEDVRSHVRDRLAAEVSVGFRPSSTDTWHHTTPRRSLPLVERHRVTLHEVSLVAEGAVRGSRVLALDDATDSTGGVTRAVAPSPEPATATRGALVAQLKTAEAERDRILDKGHAPPANLVERILALTAELERRKADTASATAWLDDVTAADAARQARREALRTEIAAERAEQQRMQDNLDARDQRRKVREIITDRRNQGLEPPRLEAPPRTYTEAERDAIRQREADRQWDAIQADQSRRAEILGREEARHTGRTYEPADPRRTFGAAYWVWLRNGGRPAA